MSIVDLAKALSLVLASAKTLTFWHPRWLQGRLCCRRWCLVGRAASVAQAVGARVPTACVPGAVGTLVPTAPLSAAFAWGLPRENEPSFRKPGSFLLQSFRDLLVFQYYIFASSLAPAKVMMASTELSSGRKHRCTACCAALTLSESFSHSFIHSFVHSLIQG